MPVTAQCTVADTDKENLVRFYRVIPSLSIDDIEFATTPGGTPAVVTDTTERSYASAQKEDLVLAWGLTAVSGRKPTTITQVYLPNLRQRSKELESTLLAWKQSKKLG